MPPTSDEHLRPRVVDLDRTAGDVETRISVSGLGTVEPGPHEVAALYTDVEGSPVRRATVTATGDSARLPIFTQ